MAVHSLALKTNVSSLNAQSNLMCTEKSMGTSMQRMSSGLRINQAADDAVVILGECHPPVATAPSTRYAQP